MYLNKDKECVFYWLMAKRYLSRDTYKSLFKNIHLNRFKRGDYSKNKTIEMKENIFFSFVEELDFRYKKEKPIFINCISFEDYLKEFILFYEEDFSIFLYRENFDKNEAFKGN